MADPKAIFDDDRKSTSQDKASDRDLLDSQPACLKCGQVQRMMKCCTKCHAAFYCSKACFAKHWPQHKKACQPHASAQQDCMQQHTETDCDKAGRTRYRVVQHHKAIDVVPLAVNFQKAADALATLPNNNNPAELPQHCHAATTSTSTSSSTPEHLHTDDSQLPGKGITLRYNKQKHKFKVCDVWDADTIFAKISAALSCLPEHMRVIHKGKQLSAETLRSCVSPGVVFQVLGEPMEDASGLAVKDIEVLMRQMGVERNVAVRALRQTGGDLIDAMMAVGNK